MVSKAEAVNDAVAPHVTGVQFSNIWLSIEAEDEFSLATDDGVALTLTSDEVALMVDNLLNLIHVHDEIFKAPQAAD